MKFDFKAIFHRIDWVMAIAKSLAVFCSYWLGTYITGLFHEDTQLLGAMLASISSIVVLQADVKTSEHQGWLRVLGTFIGAVIAYLYLTLFPFTIEGMILSVFVLELMCMLVKIPDNGKMATITLVVVLIISKKSPDLPPLLNGFLRFSEASIGAIVSIVMAYAIEYFHLENRT